MSAVLSLISSVTPPPPTSLTPPARDAHPVSYRFLSPRAGNGWSPWIHELQGASRKWSNCSTCNEEIEQPQQRGGRTGGVHSHRHIYKQYLTHKHPPTSPTAVGTETTTQEAKCEQSNDVHTAQKPSSSLSFTHTEALVCQLVCIDWRRALMGLQLRDIR